MSKIFKLIAAFFKFLYNLLDKYIITPISKVIYTIDKKINKNNFKIEKILNRPNMLLYISLGLAIIVFVLIDSKVINLIETEAEIITNQPIIARGEATVEDLEEIHNKMETLLGKEGAYLDAIYYCPHHPHKGYEGERPELKIDCTCRKPKPGMLLKAAEDFNIDLSQSWMVGDGENDIKAGYNAGCRTALIGRESYGQTVTIPTLKEFVEQCLK